jgi:CRISPR-associated protein Cas1
VKRLDDGTERRLPFESVEGISVFGMAQISTRLVRECITANVPIGYYTEDGHYFGQTSSLEHVDPARQKAQIVLTDDGPFCLQWSKIVINAKVRNSLTFLESLRDVYDFAPDDLHGLRHSLDNLQYAETVDMAIGFEGNAAKSYFRCLSKAVQPEQFQFDGRSTRPPKDPVNAMLSYGYSLLYRNIIGAIERHGLHPYFGFMHKVHRGHAALSSDLMEELRAPVVDRAVLDLVNSGEIDETGFQFADSGAVYMAKPTMQKLTARLSRAMVTGCLYYSAYDDRKSYGFQVMLDKKIASVIEAIEHRNAGLYRPVIWQPEP